MPDPTSTPGLARRILRRIPGARPLIHRILATRQGRSLLEMVRAARAPASDRPVAAPSLTPPPMADETAAQAAARTAALHMQLFRESGAGAAPANLEAAAQRFRHLAEEAAALRATLAATERERQAALERADLQATLARQFQQGMDGLGASLASEIHATRDRLSWEMKSVEAQVLASRSWLDGLVRSMGRPQQASGGQAATLYLDLLEQSLTGTLSGDLSVDPWTAGSYDPARRAIGRDWPATACTMIGSARMRNLRHLLERALAEGVPGDFIETGVWRGGACIYARGIMAAHGDATRRVFVADSFCGLPEPDAEAFPADAGDQHSSYSQLAVSRDQVAENFRRYGLLDERVVFLEGWFKDTLPAAPIAHLAVLRLDGDMYESTIQALEALYHKVSPGGFVIVDDYLLGPCARAIEDFRLARGITAPLEPVDGAAVWWQVPG